MNRSSNVSRCNVDTEFPCDDGLCILKSLLCDGIQDCKDGSDEPSTCAILTTRPCTIVEFRCQNHKCIPLQFVCNGDKDCRDGSDETISDCWNPCQLPGEFHCPANPKSNSCFPLAKRCDGVLDCVDGRDEIAGCGQENSSRCGTDEHQCPDGKCIPPQSLCNHFVDCLDGSDEMNCGCDNATEMECKDKSRCLYREWRCDGTRDCLDGSDEEDCPLTNVSTAACLYPSRACGGTPTATTTTASSTETHHQCLLMSKFCDGVQDCVDGADEGPLCYKKQCSNSGSSSSSPVCSNGTCQALPDGSFACLCRDGFGPDEADQQTCKRIDRCGNDDTAWGLCAQKCVTTDDVSSGFRCECLPNFKLAKDKFTCQSTDNRSAFLIFSSRHEIRMIDLSAPDIQPILVPSLRNTIAIDFLYDAGENGRQLIFWSDVVDDKIYSGSLVDAAVFDVKQVVENSLPTAEGIAVDWIGRNLYWVESTLDQIEVSRVDGQHRCTVIAGNMTNPRAIVVDPQEGMLFWTDWDPDYPRIESASMAGEDRRVLVNISAVQGGKWPNGLAIDFEAQPHRLYWIDAYSDAIHCCTVHGLDIREVVRGGDFIQHPFAVALFGSHVYWTDWRTNSVHKANKWNGSDVMTVTQVSTQPFDVHIVHSSLQPKARNPCLTGNGGCSHLCLVSLKGTRRCACPHLTQFKNGSDSQCEQFRNFMLFSRTTEIRGVTLDKSHHNFIPAVINVQNATTMDIDVARDQVYWVDAKAKTVVRASLNGTQVETVVDSPGGPRPTDIAIDWISRTVFVAFAMDGPAPPGEISVSTLSGEFRKTLMSDQIITPISIAISPLLGIVAWADIGHPVHRIEIASANGRDRQLLVDETSGRDFRLPKSLTFGHGQDSSRLFWISRTTEQIQFCQFTGRKCVVQTLKAPTVVAPVAISYYHQSLLVAVGRFDPAIGIFNLTSRSFEVIRPDTPSVVSVKMFSPLVQQGSNACSYRNGNCSQLCLPNSPTTRTCNCTAGYLLDPHDEAACVPLNSTLLFSIGAQIHGIALDPTQPDELLPRISRISMATSLDFEAESSFLYWVDPKTSTLNRIRRDLTGRQVIVEDDVTSVDSVAVDWMAGNIYWTNPVGRTIEVARLNGSSRFVVLHEDIEQPKAIAVHPGKGLIFWSDNGGKAAKIERASLDGSNRVAMGGVQRVTDITVDYEENKIYWCDAGLDRIERANLDFTGRTVLVSNASIVMDPVAIVVFLNYVYWTDRFPQRGVIYRADKANPRSPTIIRRGLNATVNDLIIFSKERQKGKNLCSVDNGGCEELCFFTGNSNRTCACAHGILAKDGKTCDAHSSFLLYSRGRSIESAHLLTDTNKNDPIAKLQNSSAMINVIGLAFDYSTSRIFYSDIQKGELFSVRFNGTQWRTVASGVGSAEGLAFDVYKQELYWTSYNNASVFRIAASEDAVNQVPQRVVQLTMGDKLRNLAIDACQQKLYWTNWNKDAPSIQRVGFDGKDLESLITTDIKTPNAIAIDHKSQYLFWADALLDKIERSRLDGTERKVLLWESVRHPFALTVHGDHIYWTDWIMRAVVGANKYTGLDVVKIRENLGRQPMGIVAVSSTSQDCSLNPCLAKNGGCSEQCYPSENGTVAVCYCFNNRTVLADGVSCEVGTVRCAADQFRCGSGKCIPLLLTCDMKRHCDDGTDEDVEYCTYRTCPAGFISCKTSRKCVPEALRCNRRDECGDGTDEIACVCDDSEFRCKSTGDCIKTEYRCDGEQDCGDSSDEIGCHGRKCETTPDGRLMLACPNSAMCYLPEWMCDGDNDCGDYFDEQNCTGVAITTPQPCSKDSFRCASGHGCVPNSWRCDGESDCLDHSDEENCSIKCPSDSFECSDGSCIPMMWKCDGVPECPGGSDEAFELCHQTNCSQTDFRCAHTGLCIPGDWRCDGEIDCGRNDSSDETEGCDTISRCSFNEYRCRNNRCVPGEFICDSEDDCGDFSDETRDICGERNMTHDTNLAPTEDISCHPPAYRCKNGKLCINESLTCDNKDDCGDMSDEIYCGLIDCKPDHCGPNGKCVEKPIGYECKCNPGYAVSNKTGECVDYNECDSFPCSHFCYNTIGSYRCVCSNGYTAVDSGRSCKAVSDVQPVLLYSNKHFIRNVSFKGDQRFLVRGNLSNAVALDFEWSSQCLFYSDVTPSASSINKWCLHEPANHVEILHSATVHNPDGIAVDWIAKNLYWCDKGTDTIEVSRLDGGSRKVLLKEGLQEPRALVVDPHHGYLFWSDWGHTPHIGKMGMDGSNIFRLQLDRTELGWPNAMTIDYVTNTIFWADARFDYIAMADLNLQHRRRVLENSLSRPDQLRHVFALSVFEDSIFWTDWETKNIHRANKFSGANMTAMDASSHRPMDIQVFHPFRQMPLSFNPNPCDHNHGCSNLCLLRPTNNTKIPVTGACACPDNYVLDHDGRGCLANCSAAHFVCRNTFKCIPKWWKCDGQDDCGDGFDELNNCGRNFTCTPGEFQCTTTHQCLHPTNICDGIRQCSDGSDEDGSIVDCSSYLCLASQFKCPQSHHCIPRSHVCDGRADCKNGEDEKSCQRTGSGDAKKCTSLQFECKDGSCISQTAVCDNKPDCKDRSDEAPALNCTALPCGRSDMYRCLGDGVCIPDARRCDGIEDCLDGSDEKAESCGGTTGKCDPAVYFVCNETKKCISQKWVCDDEEDCADGSDEKNCAVPCGPSEFSCDDHCIDLKFRCDGEHDCRDGSDEANCTSICPEGHMSCADDSGICISEKWKCDGVIDCPDGSDESGCDHSCAPDEHTCKNKRCIVKQWLCDGEDDCQDRSDEDADLCSRFPCFPDRFRCNSGTCILQAQKCDGHRDCVDGSDETMCASKDQVCRFRCANGRCLSNLKEVCDGVNNCGDKSDEDACRLNPCTRYGQCSQRCLWDGDVDNFTCMCDTGFRNILHGKNRTCLAEGPPAFLLVAEQNQLRSLDPYHRRGEYRQLMELKDERISFVDVDMSNPQEPVIFWSSRENRVIYRQNLPKKRKERADFDRNEPLPLIANVQEPRGLAVDWVNDRLFWIDGHTKQIEMSYLNGTLRTPIVTSGLAEPYDLVVDPESGYIIWSDISGNPRIERARFDGTDREILAQDNIRYPTGLAIDYANRRLYWADPKTGAIETMTVEGKDRRRVKHSIFDKEKPYNVDVFEDQLFVSTSKNNTIFRLNKFGLGNATVLAKGLRRPATILIVQEKKQNRQLPSLCAADSCEKGMICVAVPPVGHRCICSGYSTYNEARKQCEGPPDTSCKPPCQNGGKCGPYLSGTGFACRCPPQYTGPSCAVPKCSSYCYNNGNCSFNGSTPKCACAPPFSGDRCQQNLCVNLHYCENGGNCSVDAKGSLVCACPSEWVGRRCDIPRHECDNFCRNSGSCYMQDGKPHCNCLSGFSGKTCTEGEGECGRCHNKGICFVDKTGTDRCKCKADFKGDKCEECDDLQCSNHGVCAVNGGKPRCNCSAGYSGQRCQKDLCQGFCKAGTCIRSHPPRCNCPPSRTGARCEIEQDCACRNNGTCGELIKGGGAPERRCKCIGNFYGKLCEFVPDCAALQCLNGGKCITDPHTKFRCDCPPSRTGSRCESEQMCYNFCLNGGTCLPPLSGYGTPTCICSTDYMGTHCDTHIFEIEPPTKDESETASTETAVAVGIPIVIILLALLVVAGTFAWKRRSRAKAFQHILMEEVGGDGHDVAISNPMFQKDESGYEDEDVLHPDKVAFANPIYESCFYNRNGRKNGDTEKAGLLQLQDEDAEVIRNTATLSTSTNGHVKV
ncbi:Prolow-density lipoprotein receptor-related protein 1 [Hypsibius exemplaris]|uniref:Prolow-density lipoprotein receptor-related protein 1 n=1 Tax=Hypsibius exemplaris TaxID=2072580 RepID=A0A1W0X317_HYPEX|nr:Prolow-density lipoprotein receptor-related protein 1 [Hypsibius exemplaris]